MDYIRVILKMGRLVKRGVGIIYVRSDKDLN